MWLNGDIPTRIRQIAIVLLLVLPVIIWTVGNRSVIANNFSRSIDMHVAHSASSAPVTVKDASDNAVWSLPFWAIPAGSDSLYILTDQTVDVGGAVNTNIAIGQTRIRWAMTYADGAYEVTATEIPFTGNTTEGTIGLTSELDNGGEVSTNIAGFRRFFVPTQNAPALVSTDNLMEMTISDGSLPADVYVVVMSIGTLPQPIPTGHDVIGQPYSVRSSGAIIDSLYPMLLKLRYTDTTLGEVDAHTFAVFEWDPMTRLWNELGGALDDLIGKSVTITTQRFTVYALMSTTRWQDDFTDYTGLSQRENTLVLPSEEKLLLDGLNASGFAVSRLITPAEEIGNWEQLVYNASIPAGTTLTIDLLDSNNTPLLTDLASGTDLSAINPDLYPSLKLRANFTTDTIGESATLDQWQISWQAPTFTNYLPLINNSE